MRGELCWQNQELCPLAQAGCWVPPRGRSPLLCSEGFINQRASVHFWLTWIQTSPGRDYRGGKIASLNRPQPQLQCPLTGSELKHRGKQDGNRVSHLRTSRQKKVFPLGGCFLHFPVIGIPNLLSKAFVLAFRETGLEHSSWTFFPAPGDLLIPLHRPASTVCLNPRCSNQSRRDIKYTTIWHPSSQLSLLLPHPCYGLAYTIPFVTGPARAFQNAKVRTRYTLENIFHLYSQYFMK